MNPQFNGSIIVSITLELNLESKSQSLGKCIIVNPVSKQKSSCVSKLVPWCLNVVPRSTGHLASNRRPFEASGHLVASAELPQRLGDRAILPQRPAAARRWDHAEAWGGVWGPRGAEVR